MGYGGKSSGTLDLAEVNDLINSNNIELKNMNNNHLIIQIDDTYAKLIGQAVYSFGYYEWMIVYLINSLDNGFVLEYSRKKLFTSGKVAKKLKGVIDQINYSHKGINKSQLEDCHVQFHSLIDKRNALMHGHPITHVDESQILAYQTIVTKSIPDITWTVDALMGFISEINKAISSTSSIHDRLVR